MVESADAIATTAMRLVIVVPERAIGMRNYSVLAVDTDSSAREMNAFPTGVAGMFDAETTDTTTTTTDGGGEVRELSVHLRQRRNNNN